MLRVVVVCADVLEVVFVFVFAVLFWLMAGLEIACMFTNDCGLLLFVLVLLAVLRRGGVMNAVLLLLWLVLLDVLRVLLVLLN